MSGRQAMRAIDDSGGSYPRGLHVVAGSVRVVADKLLTLEAQQAPSAQQRKPAYAQPILSQHEHIFHVS